MTVDSGDDRFLARENPKGEQTAAVARHAARGDNIASALGERRSAAGEIGSCTERPSASGDDHNSDFVPGIDLVERRDHLVHHRARERVQRLGTVHRERCDAIGNVECDLGVGHTQNITRCFNKFPYGNPVPTISTDQPDHRRA